MGGIVSIQKHEFQEISSMVYSNFGIHLTEKKMSLVQGRLNKVLREKGYDSFSRYFQDIKTDDTGMMLIELIDKISTNHTYFFRETGHFELLNSHILNDIDQRFLNGDPAAYRMWCAGCATGEEAYTLAMVLREHFPGLPEKPRHPLILATDISTKALGAAIRGRYEKKKLEMVPNHLVNKYFIAHNDGGYMAKDSLKNLILFKRLNFIDDQFPFKRRFHVIFCRNVMIYFDQDTRRNLVKKFHDFLVPRGYLCIGHSESITRTNTEFEFIAPAAYQRRM